MNRRMGYGHFPGKKKIISFDEKMGYYYVREKIWNPNKETNQPNVSLFVFN